MIIDIKQNSHNLRSNIKNIKEFNYVSFNETDWGKVGVKLSKHLSKVYKGYPYKVEIEATKINPVVKMYFATKDDNNEYICTKLTPYEVMIRNSSDTGFKYHRRITQEWQCVLRETFGDAYERSKNKHYGIRSL